jgi:ribonuclease J
MTNQKQNTKNNRHRNWYGNRNRRAQPHAGSLNLDRYTGGTQILFDGRQKVAPVAPRSSKIEPKTVPAGRVVPGRNISSGRPFRGGQRNVRTDGRMNVRTDGQTNTRTNEQRNERTNEQKRHGGFRPFNRNRKNIPLRGGRIEPIRQAPRAQGQREELGKSSDVLRIIPLGGCEEVGRNMTVFEYGHDIVLVDMGMQFPEEDMPGIDYIIPNTDYLKGKEKNIRGVVFTHGHMDHIGAAPLLIGKLGNPVIVGSRLTIHMIKARQDDYKKGSAKNLKALEVTSFSDAFNLGVFKIKFFPVSHSIMDATGIILETPVGTVIHPGDWKIEHDPTEGKMVNYEHLAHLKRPTILMLESLGSTNSKPPVSERVMYKNIEKIVAEAPGRVIVGTFSSMLERIKVLLEMAEKYGKKVAVMGFSMKNNLEIAKKLGYIKTNLKLLVDIGKTADLADNKLIVICTGAQGEENAAMARIANGEDRHLKFKKTDTVIFSSSVIPGNERTVQKLKDLIYRQSDNVIHSDIMDVHSSGHATIEDFKEILRQINATYLIPVYANHFMLKEAAKLAKAMGYADNHVFVPDNGSVIEFGKFSAKILPKKVMTDPVFVDGLGISDLQNVVLRDRQTLSEGGMIVVIVAISRRQKKLVHNPDIISRGFVYLKENKELIEQVRKRVRKLVEGGKSDLPLDDDYLKDKIRNDIGQFVFSKTEKRPMVLPVVIEV